MKDYGDPGVSAEHGQADSFAAKLDRLAEADGGLLAPPSDRPQAGLKVVPRDLAPAAPGRATGASPKAAAEDKAGPVAKAQAAMPAAVSGAKPADAAGKPAAAAPGRAESAPSRPDSQQATPWARPAGTRPQGLAAAVGKAAPEAMAKTATPATAPQARPSAPATAATRAAATPVTPAAAPAKAETRAPTPSPSTGTGTATQGKPATAAPRPEAKVAMPAAGAKPAAPAAAQPQPKPAAPATAATRPAAKPPTPATGATVAKAEPAAPKPAAAATAEPQAKPAAHAVAATRPEAKPPTPATGATVAKAEPAAPKPAAPAIAGPQAKPAVPAVAATRPEAKPPTPATGATVAKAEPAAPKPAAPAIAEAQAKPAAPAVAATRPEAKPATPATGADAAKAQPAAPKPAAPATAGPQARPAAPAVAATPPETTPATGAAAAKAERADPKPAAPSATEPQAKPATPAPAATRPEAKPATPATGAAPAKVEPAAPKPAAPAASGTDTPAKPAAAANVATGPEAKPATIAPADKAQPAAATERQAATAGDATVKPAAATETEEATKRAAPDQPGPTAGPDAAAPGKVTEAEEDRGPDPSGRFAGKAEVPEGKSRPVTIDAPIEGSTGPVLRKADPQAGPKDKATFHKRLGPEDFAGQLKQGLAAVRRNLLLVFTLTCATNFLVLAIPIYLFQISDRVLTSRSVDTLIMLTVVIVGAVVLQSILDAVRRFMLMRTAVEVAARLGASILSAAAHSSLNGSGREYQTLGDLQQLRSFLVSGTLISFLDVPFAPLFMLVIFLIHPDIGMIVMVTAVVLFVIALINQRMTAQPFADATAAQSRANLHLDSMARNSQVINAMAMIPEAVSIWGRDTAASLTAQVRAQDRNIISAAVSRGIRLLTQVGMLGWGAYLALQGEMTGGMVIAASIIAGRALAPIEGAIEGWHAFLLSRAAYGRIVRLLTGSRLQFERLRLPRPEGRLDVERLLYVPGGTKQVILNGISFSLKPGETLAVIGNSGAGKTTLGKMLVGSILPTSGNVRLDLMDLRNWDPRQLGENVGYLPQDVQLFPGTIKQNIGRMRADATDEQIHDAAVLADVHDMIAQLPQGYETMVAADGAPLSGGQKQRIALARAFFGTPRFVVLDEPNSNLDVAGDKALARAIEHARDSGITTIVITQKPALLSVVDKIMLLNNGNVALFGQRDQVLAKLNGGNTPAPAGQVAQAPAARAING